MSRHYFQIKLARKKNSCRPSNSTAKRITFSNYQKRSKTSVNCSTTITRVKMRESTCCHRKILFTERKKTYRNEKCIKGQQEIERKEIELRDAMMIVIFILRMWFMRWDEKEKLRWGELEKVPRWTLSTASLGKTRKREQRGENEKNIPSWCCVFSLSEFLIKISQIVREKQWKRILRMKKCFIWRHVSVSVKLPSVAVESLVTLRNGRISTKIKVFMNFPENRSWINKKLNSMP